MKAVLAKDRQRQSWQASKAVYWIDAIKGRGGVAVADIYGNDLKRHAVNVKETALMTKCHKKLVAIHMKVLTFFGWVMFPLQVVCILYRVYSLTVSEYKFCTNQALGPSHYLNLYCATLNRND